ncbi:MAG: nucleotide exchange factor GrpE [Peptostreptococcaceae bacterium]|nr:nucleotide exchange factor GrpE [Peptostreptococcaceae bacterium]
MNKGKRGAPLDDELNLEDEMEDMKETEETEETEEVKADKFKKTKHKEVKEKDEVQTAEEEAVAIKYLRLMADFQNYKRRVEKEKSDIYAFANEKIVLELLDVIDNFERALAHQGEEGNVISDGMNMIYKQLKAVLEKSGLQEIEALGQEFDPNLHNAVMMEDSEEYEPGKVTLVMQKGYFLNKKVLRHTMVRVAK